MNEPTAHHRPLHDYIVSHLTEAGYHYKDDAYPYPLFTDYKNPPYTVYYSDTAYGICHLGKQGASLQIPRGLFLFTKGASYTGLEKCCYFCHQTSLSKHGCCLSCAEARKKLYEVTIPTVTMWVLSTRNTVLPEIKDSILGIVCMLI